MSQNVVEITRTEEFSASHRLHDPRLSDEENAERAARGRRLASITYEEILETDTAFGTPDAVAERLLELKETLGLDSIAAEINFGGLLGPEQVERSLRLFAEVVAPKLR